MSQTQPEVTADVREKVEIIVARGQDIRRQVSQVVAETAQNSHREKEGLIGITRSVMEGAAGAANKAVSHSPESVLRQVIDGLGDGLSAAALAAQLAIEEANARRQAFAQEDLEKLRKELQILHDLFEDTVSSAAGKFKSATAEQLQTLREHALQTNRRIQPSLKAALHAVKEHPLRLARESVEAGLALPGTRWERRSEPSASPCSR